MIDLESARAKITRGVEHYAALARACQDFTDSQPHDVTVDFEADVGCYVARFNVRKEPPHNLSLILGDLVHNPRAALDHAAWQAACLCNSEQDLLRPGTRNLIHRAPSPRKALAPTFFSRGGKAHDRQVRAGRWLCPLEVCSSSRRRVRPSAGTGRSNLAGWTPGGLPAGAKAGAPCLAAWRRRVGAALDSPTAGWLALTRRRFGRAPPRSTNECRGGLLSP